MNSELDRLQPALEARVKVVLEKIARDVEARAKSTVPVDTGALKNSIRASPVSNLTWQVAVGQFYGIYVEFGTHRMPARPYLVPAVDDLRSSFQVAMAIAMSDAATDVQV